MGMVMHSTACVSVNARLGARGETPGFSACPARVGTPWAVAGRSPEQGLANPGNSGRNEGGVGVGARGWTGRGLGLGREQLRRALGRVGRARAGRWVGS